MIREGVEWLCFFPTVDVHQVVVATAGEIPSVTWPFQTAHLLTEKTKLHTWSRAKRKTVSVKGTYSWVTIQATFVTIAQRSLLLSMWRSPHALDTH